MAVTFTYGGDGSKSEVCLRIATVEDIKVKFSSVSFKATLLGQPIMDVTVDDKQVW